MWGVIVTSGATRESAARGIMLKITHTRPDQRAKHPGSTTPLSINIRHTTQHAIICQLPSSPCPKLLIHPFIHPSPGLRSHACLSRQGSIRGVAGRDPQVHDDVKTNHPGDGAGGRPLAVVLKEDVDVVVQEARDDVAESELVELLGGNAGHVGGHDARGVQRDGLEAVAHGGFGALDALQLDLVEGGVLGEDLFDSAGAIELLVNGYDIEERARRLTWRGRTSCRRRRCRRSEGS